MNNNQPNPPNNSPTLTVLIPVYNEAATIAELLQSLKNAVAPYQVIIIDNGSTDNSAEKIKSFCNSQTNQTQTWTYLHYDELQGKGAAINAALPLAKGDYVVIQDGDLEYDPADITRLFNYACEHQAKAVFGSRILNQKAGISYQRYYWGGRFLTWLANSLFDVGITDEATCYKLIDRKLLLAFKLESQKFEFCPEVVAKLGLSGIKIHELPISYYPRSIEEGKKIRGQDGLTAIWTLVKWSLKSNAEKNDHQSV